MLKQEELVFIKAISCVQVSPAHLKELRLALSSRKKKTAVSAGIPQTLLQPAGGQAQSQ
jgi:hypothetical protein